MKQPVESRRRPVLPPFEFALPEDTPAARVWSHPVENGRYWCGTMLGVSFACLLALPALGLPIDWRAGLAFVASLPLLASYFVVTRCDPGRHDVSRVMRLLPLFGLLFSFVGLVFLVNSTAAGTGVVLTLLTTGVILILADAEERARNPQREKSRASTRRGLRAWVQRIRRGGRFRTAA